MLGMPSAFLVLERAATLQAISGYGEVQFVSSVKTRSEQVSSLRVLLLLLSAHDSIVSVIGVLIEPSS